jgi:hypothetical protein
MRPAVQRDQAADVRAALTDAREVCRVLGLDEAARPQARGLMIRCPWHEDRTPSCSVREAGDGTIAVKCHGCGASGDVLHLLAVARGLDITADFPEVLKQAAELAGMSPDSGRPPRVTAQRPQPRSHEPEYPPTDQVAAIWAASRPVDADAEVATWLRSRGLDPAVVEEMGLARALPVDVELPGWARFQGRPWNAIGYRAVIPMFDGTGALRSFRARRVLDHDGPKALPPAGYRVGGLVMADVLARTLLATGSWPEMWPARTPLRVVVAEGEPDHLTWASARSEADATAPAVLGIVAGAWTDSIAARVPDGSRIIVWTHHDQAGEKYALHILKSLRDRCTVLRGGAGQCELCPGYGWVRG